MLEKGIHLHAHAFPLLRFMYLHRALRTCIRTCKTRRATLFRFGHYTYFGRWQLVKYSLGEHPSSKESVREKRERPVPVFRAHTASIFSAPTRIPFLRETPSCRMTLRASLQFTLRNLPLAGLFCSMVCTYTRGRDCVRTHDRFILLYKELLFEVSEEL